MASLLCDPAAGGRRVALVEQVATLRAEREQGLARATVSAALHRAAGWGAELVALATDAEDWPQLMYAGLGFRPLGVQWACGRRGSGGRRR
jgi:GNAT superfamily N-acetyltransferase